MAEKSLKKIHACHLSSKPNPVGFGSEPGSTLSTGYRVSRKGSVEGQEIRAASPPSSQHLDGKELAHLTSQNANESPGCNAPRVWFCSLE